MLELRNVTRRFGSAVAVDDVSLSVSRGEMVGLVGENGAGKTTLMRIAAGELAPDSGSLSARSVTIVHQHFALVPEFTIAENLALVTNRRFRFLSRAALNAEAQRTIAATGIDLPDAGRRAGELSVGEKARLELVKAIAAAPEVLILDEPTAVLTPLETEDLFAVIRRLAGEGTSVVFISHKVPEVLAIAQRIVVMRAGRIVADRSSSGMSADDIAMAMVGRKLEGGRARQVRQPGPPILQDGNLQVGAGEIAAVIGVAGNGQAELVERLRASVEGAFIPEDRTRDGLVSEMTIAENLALGSPRWRPAEATSRASRLIDEYGIRATGPEQAAGALSGGNQQKVILARELDRRPAVIVASEPTRGLDVEATLFVHDQLRAAVEGGAALLLITSDLDEALSLADTVQVIYRGKLSERLSPGAPIERIARLMAGIE